FYLPAAYGIRVRNVTGVQTCALPISPFMVIATQNPIEYEGTYPLPEAQLDRFMLKVKLDLPARSEEIEILNRHATGFRPTDLIAAGLTAVAKIGRAHV